MSDWDLMMPGMGLTAIGLAGVILSYMGIANTFLTGMQALSGLTMFVGLVFLSAGILNGGISTSGKAKATTLVIFGISGSVGAYALSLNTVVTSLPRFVGVLLVILVPSIVIAFTSMKMPQYFKPIAIIFVAAMAVGIGSYTALGFIGPGAQFSLHPQNATTTEKATPPVPTAPLIPVEIPLNASVQGNPSFNPGTVSVPKGDMIEWTNNDNVAHTVTNSPDGSIFDSGIISAGKKYQLDTSKLDVKEYDYLCTVHPFMSGKIVITGQAKPSANATKMVVTNATKMEVANVTIPSGASTQKVGQKYFDPQEIDVKIGTTVVWTNDDSVSHTVTDGKPSDNEFGKMFDSGLIKANKTFEYTFSSAGSFDYFCQVHPWMTGKVTVG